MFSIENYIFLFDKEMNFSKMPNFDPNHDLSPNDIMKLRKINRNILFDNLCEFKNLKDVDEDLQKVFQTISVKSMYDKETGNLLDQQIDNEFKKLLVMYQFGYYLKKVSGHLEYFYNTLNCEMVSSTENPFKMPEKYWALNYRADAGPGEKRESKYEDPFDQRTKITIDSNATPETPNNDNSIEKDDSLNSTNKNLKIPLAKLSSHQQSIRRKS